MNRKEEIEARKMEIREEVEATEDADKLEELEAEVETLNEEIEEINEQEEKEDISEQLENNEVVAEEVSIEEERKNGGIQMETRNTKEYINAFAEYLKSENADECRALITTGGYATGNSATVEVPDMVYDIVKTAWEREDLISQVKKLSVKGNLKVQFEVSGSDASIHTEGSGAASEEELILGVVQLTPVSIKKWISVSDEVLDLRGEEFLNYIYDEITYRIAKKCADTLVSKIASLPQSLVANNDGVYDSVSAAKITGAPALDTIVNAISQLSDEARDITIVMNKGTYAAFKAAQFNANYAQDVFEGHRVVFNNSLPAYSTANAGSVYAIVGDFNEGALINFPNGEGIDIKYDDKTAMEYDLVRILGREYVGIEAVADKAFTLIAKDGEVSE